MAWTLTGQTGATLNATGRTLPGLNISSAQLTFASLAADTFVWTAATTNSAGAGTTVPDMGQLVQVYQDGVRRFRGHVTKVKVGMRGITVEAAGPWWWMTRLMLSSTRTSPNGDTDERAQYVFPTGDLRGMIINLLDRAIAVGTPMGRGTGDQIAAMYDVCKVTLSNMSYAAALAKLLSRVPDAVTWFDYDTGETFPRLKIARRNGADAMTPLTLSIGTDRIEQIDISPRLDLEIDRVELPFMDRNPVTGKPRFQKQGSGTAALGKLQITTISGPEIVERIPKEDFESYLITTDAEPVSRAYVAANDSFLTGIREQFGPIPGGIGNSVTTYTVGQSFDRANTTNFPKVKYLRSNGEAFTNLTGRRLVLSPDIPEWVIQAYGGVRVTITGTWVALWADSQQGVGKPWSKAFAALRAGAQTGSGREFRDAGNSAPVKMVDWLARPFTVQGVLINTHFPRATRVYKPWDFDFLNPPDGMAAGLRVAQNWIPWEGPITDVHDSLSGNNLLNRTINLNGSLAACAAMQATLKSLSYDLIRGRRTFQLGAPARIDFGTAVGRVAASPQDVIVEL